MKEKIRVFLVDDHELVRESIKDVLEISGCFLVVGQANNGKNALKDLVCFINLDYVILDVNLPDINGILLIPKIKAINPKVKVIMLTMNDDDETKSNAIKYGATAFFTKNFQKEKFISELLNISQKKSTVTQKLALQKN